MQQLPNQLAQISAKANTGAIRAKYFYEWASADKILKKRETKNMSKHARCRETPAEKEDICGSSVVKRINYT